MPPDLPGLGQPQEPGGALRHGAVPHPEPRGPCDPGSLPAALVRRRDHLRLLKPDPGLPHQLREWRPG